MGAAIVDEAVEREADLLVVGLPYRKRFGGDFAIGRTVPMRPQECAVRGMGGPRADARRSTRKRSSSAAGGSAGSSPASLDAAGHDVIIIDLLSAGLRSAAADFGGEAFRGDGTDEDALRRAGADGADFFLALTEGDNRNIMAAQLAW